MVDLSTHWKHGKTPWLLALARWWPLMRRWPAKRRRRRMASRRRRHVWRFGVAAGKQDFNGTKTYKKTIWLGGIKIHWQWVTPCYSPFLDADVGITGGFCWPGFPIQWTEMRSAEHGKDWADWAAGGLRQTFWLSLQRTSCPMGVA